MLLLGSRLIDSAIMGIQTGSKIAETGQPLVDPYELKVAAYEAHGPLVPIKPSFIRVDDIREISDIGMIIDSADEIIQPDDVIKIKELYELDFTLIGLVVIDENKKKLGKVSDYTLDTDDFIIQQLTVRAGLFSSLSTTGHVIHRSQITKITRSQVIVKSTETKLTDLETEGPIHRTYTNPFRTPPAKPQPETTTPS